MKITLRRSSAATQEMVQQFSQFPYDCRIMCKDGYVEAHCSVLATGSSSLRNLLITAGVTGSQSRPVIIMMLNYDCKTVRAMKKLVYEGQVEADMAVVEIVTHLKLCEDPQCASS